MPRSSTLSSPFFSFKPPGFPAHLPGLQIMSVDILPTALPLDASAHFSGAALPYIRTLVRKYQQQYFGQTVSEKVDDDILRALDGATVATAGKLTEKHAWLQSHVEKSRSSTTVTPLVSTRLKHSSAPKKKILLLGSGMVSGPVVDHIARREDIRLTIGTMHSLSSPIF